MVSGGGGRRAIIRGRATIRRNTVYVTNILQYIVI